MTTHTKEDLSIWMSGYMDEIGFDQNRIQERIQFHNKCSRAKDISTKCILKNDSIEKIFVGSIREGIGMDFCNDLDILQINHAVFCSNGGTTTENGKLNFKMEQNRAPAGYTLLKLERSDTDPDTFESLKYAVVDMKRGKYLSSKRFMAKHDDVFQYGDGYISKNTNYKEPRGPSIPKYVENSWIEKFAMSLLKVTDTDMDFVRAFPCQEDRYLKDWQNRDRKCGWPSQKTIANVMSMPVYVVPVGKKGSINEDLQWRISYTMAETHLIQTFTNTQTKIYVLMKLIAKHILQPVCSAITSYVMKTVMLWQAENIPERKFCENDLLSRLMDALAFLEKAVKERNLPSYMIPEKNLFENKLTMKEQKLVLQRLEFLLIHGRREVSEFFNDCLNNAESIHEICDSMYLVNFIDKVQTCALFTFTTEELANYFTKMFKCKSQWMMLYYNAIYIWRPFYLKYGKEGFHLLNHATVLPTSLLDIEEKHKAIIKESPERTSQEPAPLQTVNQQLPELHLYSVGKSRFFSKLLVLSLVETILVRLLQCFFLNNLLFKLLASGMITESYEAQINIYSTALISCVLHVLVDEISHYKKRHNHNV